MANIGDIVKHSYFGLSYLDAKNKNDWMYRVTSKGSLGDCLGSASQEGYFPEEFQQTFHQRSNAHLRLVKVDTKGYARILSEREEGSIVYTLLIPQENQ